MHTLPPAQERSTAPGTTTDTLMVLPWGGSHRSTGCRARSVCAPPRSTLTHAHVHDDTMNSGFAQHTSLMVDDCHRWRLVSPLLEHTVLVNSQIIYLVRYSD